MIDDNEEVLISLERYLRQHGAWVTCVSSGLDALDLIDLEPFHLVILDVMMPRPDGWDIFRELRQSRRTRRLPVIFLTGLMNVNQTDFLNRGYSEHCRIVTKGSPLQCLLQAIISLAC